MSKEAFQIIILLSVIFAVVFFIVRTLWRAHPNAASTSTQTQMEGLPGARTDFVPTHTSCQPHPSQMLIELFRAKPYQGAAPANAEFIFVGLDANFDADIENSLVFERVREYLEDGVAFWRRYKVHHPFLLASYTGDGQHYHRNFAQIGFKPEDAHRVSFVELLHIPTVGRSQLVAADLYPAHLDWLNSLMVSGTRRHVFLPDKVIRLMRESYRLMIKSRRSGRLPFEWLREPIPNQVLPELHTFGETTIYQMLHLANYGKFQARMTREAATIAALI
jgi:hypothetical protein